ncbi:hypothetical protein FKR81_31735 [Lentzea tibetensis]|uniref:Uncharacterized protein n=1 Tax=Lentzea tibetensis TaxID=2591470 RepID=A0A563EKY3_9PSEU|nr:hypothetical protein [Lentzea tibetensis]TWP47536.1 hypothetical protein FKR81_31735 [Lentzea tibetensis]
MTGSRVGAAVRILRAQIRAFTANFPEWRLNRANREEWVERTAVLLVLGLVSGRCGCGHHARICRPRQTRCACCVRGHALRSWVPGEMSLGEFVSIAVHGSPELRGAVWGDVFGRSMLRPVLDRAGLEPLVIADAEVRRCAACGRRFEGADTCGECGTPDDPAVNRREVARHVLLYPRAGGYRKVRRVLCHSCGGYFDTARVDAGEGCPLEACGSKLQMRCGTRGCGRWRAVDELTVPCAGCDELFSVRCHECDASRVAGEDCGHGLGDAIDERRLRLCRTQEVWVR